MTVDAQRNDYWQHYPCHTCGVDAGVACKSSCLASYPPKTHPKILVSIYIASRLFETKEFEMFKSQMQDDYGEIDSTHLETEGYIKAWIPKSHLDYSSGLVNSPAVSRISLVSVPNKTLVQSLIDAVKGWFQ